MAIARASGAMRWTRPVRTLPGPTSRNVSTPAAIMRSHGCGPSRRPAVRCSMSSARQASPRRQGSARRRWRGAARPGPRTATSASAARIPAAAAAMSGEWAATLTGSTIARFAPRSRAASLAAASTAARSPLTTICPGELRLAIVKTPAARAGRDELGLARLVEADDRGHRPVAGGRLHQPAALADEPERVAEVQRRRPRPSRCTGPSSGPRGLPGSTSRMPPARARCAATEAVRSAGCALTVRSSSSAGPSHASRDSRSPRICVGLGPDSGRGRGSVREVAAHADRLGSLSRIDGREAQRGGLPARWLPRPRRGHGGATERLMNRTSASWPRARHRVRSCTHGRPTALARHGGRSRGAPEPALSLGPHRGRPGVVA